MKQTPDWEAFGRAIMEYWPGSYAVPMDELHDWAVLHGILRRVPGGFNPEQHFDETGAAEEGDEWFVLNYRCGLN